MSDPMKPGEGRSPEASEQWVAWTKRWKKAAEEKEALRKATFAKRTRQYDTTFLEQCGIKS